MDITRREFALLTLGLLATGCTDQPTANSAHSHPDWSNATASKNFPAFPGIKPQTMPPTDLAPSNSSGLHMIPRSAWAKAPPIFDRMNSMDGVEKITIHHEGWNNVEFTDYFSAAQRMDEIRHDHIQRLGAGDIAYHYVIDRAGRLWQGRDVCYQGAHVKDKNEHNVGVMVLGNFENQIPTDAQLATLRLALSGLMRHYTVPVQYVKTHQELADTLCPGRNLQAQINMLRRSGALV